MLNQELQDKLDAIQKDLRTALAISDLLSSITNDPPSDGTIQEIGSFMTQLLQACLESLEALYSSNTNDKDGNHEISILI